MDEKHYQCRSTAVLQTRQIREYVSPPRSAKKNINKIYFSSHTTSDPSYSLPCSSWGCTSTPRPSKPSQPPPYLTNLTTPWHPVHEAWHHTCSEPITSLSSSLYPPPSLSPSSSPFHHDHTVTVTARTHWRGADAYVGEVFVLTKPDWTSAGKEEDHAVSLGVNARVWWREGDIDRKTHESMKERMCQRKWRQRAQEYMKRKANGWKRIEEKKNCTKPCDAPLQWSVVEAFLHAHALANTPTRKDPTVRQITITFWSLK